MSELRWHPLLEEWVITATHRQERTFHPPEPDYEIVVFENKFPSLLREPPEPAVAATPFSSVRPSEGVCEVVLYTPDHHATLTELPIARIEQLIYVWRDRYQALAARPEVQYVFIFENKGREIGVTLSHPHGQIYAYPFIPPTIERELRAQRRYLRRRGRCLLCEMLAFERADGRRLVDENGDWIALVPFFARYPYEVWLLPKAHRRDLLDLTEREIETLAHLLKRVLQRYDGLWHFSMPYVMAQHPRPSDGKPHPEWHFHIEFYPPYRAPDKLKYLAGSESGAGVFINDTLPEQTAAELRAVALESGR